MQLCSTTMGVSHNFQHRELALHFARQIVCFPARSCFRSFFASGGFGESEGLFCADVLINPFHDEIRNLNIVPVLHDHVTVAMDTKLDGMQHSCITIRTVDPSDECLTILEERHPVRTHVLRSIKVVAEDYQNRKLGELSDLFGRVFV